VRATSRWLLAALAVAGFALLGKRDWDQQRRIDALAKEVAALRADAQRPASAPSTPSVFSRSFCTLDGASLDAISAMMDRAASRAVAKAAVPEAPSAPPAPPTSEQVAALAQASDLVDGVLKKRRLSMADVQAIREAFAASGDPEGTAELRQKIVVAVNHGDLVPETRHFIP
jgi:hypothetical protein